MIKVFTLSTESFATALKLWLLGTMVCFIVTNVCFDNARKKDPQTKLNPAMVFSIFWGIAAGISVIFSMFFAFDSTKEQVHAFLCVLVGAAVGWCVGMYLTPQDATERGQFAKVGAALAVLASGYGIKSLEDAASKQRFQQRAWYLVLAGLSALLTAATIYNTRAYGTNFVKIGTNISPDSKSNVISMTVGATLELKAAVFGPDDTSVAWYVLPEGDGNVVAGKFTPAHACKCKIKAESVGDPSLCAFVNVEVR